MRLRKTCPKCSTVVHVKRAICCCGHAFALKRKARCCDDSEPDKAMKRRKSERVRKGRERVCETLEQTLERREQNRRRMASMRASEAPEKTLERQEQSRAHMARMRASETAEKTLERQEQNRARIASMRASETAEKTQKRQEQTRARIASMRASETPNETLQRRQNNKQRMAKRRKSIIVVESATSAFQSEVRLGPDFVCVCCHRMMYRKSVVPCNTEKYTKVGSDVLEEVFSADLRRISCDGDVHVCKTCDRTLSRGSMPLQAKANGLKLHEIPDELSGLNALELR